MLKWNKLSRKDFEDQIYNELIMGQNEELFIYE